MEKKKVEKKVEHSLASHETEKSEDIEIPLGKWLGKLRANPWIVSTIFLAVVLVFVIVLTSFDNSSASVSPEAAGQKVLSFIESNPDLGGKVTISSSVREGALYKVNLNYQGQEVPVYTTLDAKYLVSNVVPLEISDSSPSNPIQPQNTEQGTSNQTNADNDPVLGKSTAPVTIIEFSDFQCPFCEKFYTETLPQLKKEYIDTGKAKLVFRDYPLSLHPMAHISAEAAECVRMKAGGKDAAYFKYHDKIFENQESLTAENLKKWAKEQGYNIDSCLANGDKKAEVDKDVQDGGSLGTPTFFINGVKLEGAQPFSAFKQVIDAQLEAKQ